MLWNRNRFRVHDSGIGIMFHDESAARSASCQPAHDELFSQRARRAFCQTRQRNRNRNGSSKLVPGLVGRLAESDSSGIVRLAESDSSDVLALICALCLGEVVCTCVLARMAGSDGVDSNLVGDVLRHVACMMMQLCACKTIQHDGAIRTIAELHIFHFSWLDDMLSIKFMRKQ